MKMKKKESILHPSRFRLMLFYPITSFMVIAIVSFSVGKILSINEKQELIERSETYAGFIISNLNKVMYDEFFFPLIEKDKGIDLENNQEHFLKLDKVIKKSIYGYNIKKVYLYDKNRHIIYSTIPKHMGFALQEGENPQLDSALNGVAASILRPPGQTDYRSEVVGETLLESYYPIFEFANDTRQKGRQVGAMEIYQDMVGLNQQISTAQHKTTLITAASMGILFISLILIVNKGALIIRLRTKQLGEAKEHLEERVSERTKEIEAAYDKLKFTQNKLIQSEKMAGIGKFAAGIAHEINNPLASIVSCAEGLLGRVGSDVGSKDGISKIKISADDLDIFPEYLQIICSESFRCKATISKLLNFARQTEPKMAEMNINSVIQESVTIIKHQINLHKKRITINLTADPVIVIGDEHQLKQVFLNVLINASDAVGDEGEIIITTELQDDNILFKCKDNGNGINSDDLKKIFDPFFSTKRVGKGTGLGLSICYGLIKAHNGNIDASSAGEGKGAIIEITLPFKGKGKC